MAIPNVDGALVGGASLKAADLLVIANAAGDRPA
jgi:triosephosphate isomerase